jgi:hypothetical protein
VSDPQDSAEAYDQDVVDEAIDYSADDVGDDLPSFPPDRPLGVNTVGVTPVEEDAGESFAERTLREEPEDFDLADELLELDELDELDTEVGQLVDPDATSFDSEAELVAEAEPGAVLTAEEAAMHIEPER